MERQAVTAHYLRTWFALDLIASVPLDLIFRGRRFDILRLPRLLKVIRIMQYRTLTEAGVLILATLDQHVDQHVSLYAGWDSNHQCVTENTPRAKHRVAKFTSEEMT